MYAEGLIAFHFCPYPGGAYWCYAEGADELLFRSGEILNNERCFVSDAIVRDKNNADSSVCEQGRDRIALCASANRMGFAIVTAIRRVAGSKRDWGRAGNL